MQDTQPGALSADTQVTLLLCGDLGLAGHGGGPKPLTASEYNRLAKKLLASGRRPSDLLADIPDSVGGGPIPLDRLRALLARGASLALAMEKWAQRGIRVTGRGDAAYPQLLRTVLKSLAPPLLYGAGAWDLVNRDAICIVGSRAASGAGLAFARRLGATAARAHLGVISGDARGVDREGMEGALDADGSVIGVLTDRLSDAVLNKRHRKAIAAGRLLLVSPYDPDGKFTVAKAMDRNKYMYALSRAAVVVESDVKGGTWSGALENLEHRWVPAFVRGGADMPVGNGRLLDLGLHPIADTDLGTPQTFRDLVLDLRLTDRGTRGDASSASGTLPLFPERAGEGRHGAESSRPDAAAAPPPVDDPGVTGMSGSPVFTGPGDELFGIFVSHLRPLLEESPKSDQEIAGFFGIEMLQAERWLAQARASYLIRKLEDTDVYTWLEHRQKAATAPPR